MNPNESTLRAYQRTDLPAMAALDRECFAPEFLFSLASMRRFAEASQACTLVAETSKGNLAGFVIAHLERKAPGEKHGYCLTLDVREDQRRQGLGERLLRAVEQQMALSGAAVMSLHVWTGNAGAIRLYERLGYQLAGEVPAFYHPGLDALFYSKRIAPAI